MGMLCRSTLKFFEILLALIQNRGQVLEKNECCSGLARHRGGGEQPGPQHLCAEKGPRRTAERASLHLTVPGRGYRFVASVREVDGASEEFMALQTNGNGSKADADATLYPLNGAGDRAGAGD